MRIFRFFSGEVEAILGTFMGGFRTNFGVISGDFGVAPGLPGGDDAVVGAPNQHQALDPQQVLFPVWGIWGSDGSFFGVSGSFLGFWGVFWGLT